MLLLRTSSSSRSSPPSGLSSPEMEFALVLLYLSQGLESLYPDIEDAMLPKLGNLDSAASCLPGLVGRDVALSACKA